MAWTLTQTSDSTMTTTLANTFNMQEYNRTHAFTENTIDGTDGVVIDAESIRETPSRLVLRGFIKGSDAADAETQLNAIETVATKGTALTLTNTVTSTTYDCLHVSTRAVRRGAAVLEVIITLITNYTLI